MRDADTGPQRGAEDSDEPRGSWARVAARLQQALQGGARPMVSWLAPSQLLRTGVQVAISAALGTRVDPRRSRFPLDADEPPEEFDNTEDGLWFDYVADVGDGYLPTMVVARGMAQPTLTPHGWTGAPLPRGRFLLIGGDLCYPTASRQNYDERLLFPYKVAWQGVPTPEDAERPWVFAIPGNHDWYDGLVEFTRIFLQGDTSRDLRPIGLWRQRQKRSYFAVKLPHRWWLWAVDIQLESDINADQVAYFQTQAEEHLQPGDQVILCTAEPRWVHQGKGAGVVSNLDYLLHTTVKKKGARIALELAGDLHHYRHHAHATDPRSHRIICGMGGAFTHPTHNVVGGRDVQGKQDGSLRDASGTWTLRRAFPSARESEALSHFVAWKLPVRNPKFCLCLGLLHTVLAWGFPKVNVGRFAGEEQLVSVLTNLTDTGAFFAATSGESWLMAFGIPVLCMYIARTQQSEHTSPHVAWLGLAHGLAHVLWSVGFFVVLNQLAFDVCGQAVNDLLPGIVRFAVYLGVSGFMAGVLFGAYLRVAHRFFRAHANELYSAIASPHYKGFLRLHIDQQGDLRVFPMGVKRMPGGREGPRWTLLQDHDDEDHKPDGQPIFIPGPRPDQAL